ncbi:hypothetical protein BO218_00520 [Microbacterium paludicola]|nr:hypothetical protein BO218_00520 [Microbacterium paludicola]
MDARPFTCAPGSNYFLHTGVELAIDECGVSALVNLTLMTNEPEVVRVLQEPEQLILGDGSGRPSACRSGR